MSTVPLKSDSDYIEIPGYAEALAREDRIRAEAWLSVWMPTEEIAGIEVRPLTPRLLILLEEVKSAWVVPFHFESPAEMAVEAARFVWVVSTWYEAPRGPLHRLLLSWRRRRFIARIRISSGVIDGIRKYLQEALYDAPGLPADANEIKRRPCAAWPTQIIDTLCAAGYHWTPSDVLDMPFKMLWQFHVLALRRLNPECPASNPSDAFAVDYIEKLNATVAKLQATADAITKPAVGS